MCYLVCHGIAWNSNRESSPEPGHRQVCRTRSLSSDARSARRGIDPVDHILPLSCLFLAAQDGKKCFAPNLRSFWGDILVPRASLFAGRQAGLQSIPHSNQLDDPGEAALIRGALTVSQRVRPGVIILP